MKNTNYRTRETCEIYLTDPAETDPTTLFSHTPTNYRNRALSNHVKLFNTE